MQLPGTNPNFRRTLKDAYNLHVKFSCSNMRKENKHNAGVFKVEINVHIFKDADSIYHTSPYPVCRRIIFHKSRRAWKTHRGPSSHPINSICPFFVFVGCVCFFKYQIGFLTNCCFAAGPFCSSQFLRE